MNFAIELTGTGYAVPVDAIGGGHPHGGDPSEGIPQGPAAGFVVTCLVTAADEDEAGERAHAMLMADETYARDIAIHADADRARIEVTYWAELASFEGCPVPMSGFVFFADDGEDAPQA